MIPATGEQFHLTLGPWEAVVVELGAGLRMLKHGDVHVTQTYDEQGLPPWGCGLVLVPWPNRIEDGRWLLNGDVQQLDLTEPDKHNASHGLLRNTPYRVVRREDASITLAASVFPQHGYPFRLDTEVTYTLWEDGIRVTHRLLNRASRPAPFAVGAHPYLRISDVPTEDLVLTVRAGAYVSVDSRSIPTGTHPVDGTRYDLRSGARVGDLQLDTAYTQLTFLDGSAAQLMAPDGRVVELLQDSDWGWTQVFTQPAFPRPAEGTGLAVALEPLTAPANAFNTGDGLQWLPIDGAWTGGWGIRYR